MDEPLVERAKAEGVKRAPDWFVEGRKAEAEVVAVTRLPWNSCTLISRERPAWICSSDVTMTGWNSSAAYRLSRPRRPTKARRSSFNPGNLTHFTETVASRKGRRQFLFQSEVNAFALAYYSFFLYLWAGTPSHDD